ncbi:MULTISPECIES: NAD(P)-dependent alcohol dehydrogenase [unclassified Bradyrhizobium]|uniref:NAD(P)-dependent alcohol dehydrogenase n=1 Tax=unclassified Bradyrhizobium TaxID=2631580 RepID=UPI0020B3F2D6|nr:MULTISPECIES: NAD(P)-dependent alcohol dehydrogenase [unclassified Bradyrhizobium]MCP3380646.1 NAD(P)-dependent alcohol dehydrogenase [Bradyrhizobium sp. CCGUVB4N]MCP3441516.1 NAD(P)-dependent alcohol dehydrogenase [Bradyrhizobium sp. CCGUVB14]
MKIRAAVAREKGAQLKLETIDLEAPRPDEILVKVKATGVCHTDLVVRDGMLPTPLPVVLGHEGAGVVEAVGTGITKVKPGDHVVMTFNSCGGCPSCQDQAASYCHEFFPRNFFAARADGSSALSADGARINGNFFGQSSFATHAICHEVNVVKVATDVPLELLGPLACGVQTGAGAVMNALKVSAGKSFAVFGSGSVGLSALMAAHVVGATTIIAVDTNPARLEIAKSLGATHVVDPRQANAVEEIMRITGTGLNFALDTTGLPAVIRNAVESLGPRGACGILGASGPDAEIVLNETHFMSAGRRLIGIVEGDANPDVFIPTLIDLYRRGRFPFDKLVRFYNFDEINAAIHDSETGAAIKPIVRMH